jgi:hypothetical protein
MEGVLLRATYPADQHTRDSSDGKTDDFLLNDSASDFLERKFAPEGIIGIAGAIMVVSTVLVAY